MAYVEVTYQRDPASGAVLFDANGYPLQIPNGTANTYAQLQARIQNEVLGSPQPTDIQNAIQDAIQTYERESLWFNRIRSFAAPSGFGVTTIAGKEFYSDTDLPALVNYPHISKIDVLAFNNRYSLIERTTSWIDDQSVSVSWEGLPTDWAFDSGALRLYPVPNGGYPLIIDATVRFAPLVNGPDYNPWTNRAEPLIRFEAKRLLFLNITRDPDQTVAMDAEVQKQLAWLRSETWRRTGGSGRIRASRGYF